MLAPRTRRFLIRLAWNIFEQKTIVFPTQGMPREQFCYEENHQHLQMLDQAARQSGLSRGEVFADFLHMACCTLSGGQLEDQYMEVVKRHSSGERGNRSCDTIAKLFGSIVVAMGEARDDLKDILGDLHQGAITYGENAQYFSPMPVCRAMARITVADVEKPEERKSVCDPAAGSGRMLLAVAEIHPHWEFVAQDLDIRCTRVSAINLAMRGLYGYAIHGNSLTLKTHRVYRTGFNGRGFLREVSPTECPFLLSPRADSSDSQTVIVDPTPSPKGSDSSDDEQKQRTLF